MAQYLFPQDKKELDNKDGFILRTALESLTLLYNTSGKKSAILSAQMLLQYLKENQNKIRFEFLWDFLEIAQPLRIPLAELDKIDFAIVNQIDEFYKRYELLSLSAEINLYYNTALFSHFEYLSKKYTLYTHFDHIGRQLRNKKRFYELDLLAELLKLIPNGETCIDVGANIGNHSVFFANMFKKVIAIEPLTESYDLLIRNIKVNLLKNVDPVFGGISKDRRKMKTDAPDWNKGMCVLINDESGVPTITPEDLNLKSEKIDLLKIDCESMSMEVFEAFIPLIKKNKPIIVIEATPEELKTILSEVPEYKIHGKYNATATYILK